MWRDHARLPGRLPTVRAPLEALVPPEPECAGELGSVESERRRSWERGRLARKWDGKTAAERCGRDARVPRFTTSAWFRLCRVGFFPVAVSFNGSHEGRLRCGSSR